MVEDSELKRKLKLASQILASRSLSNVPEVKIFDDPEAVVNEFIELISK